ncbi:pyridoxamine 5'-phosphate oxidase family protein, partial [Streptomyces sp. NPDC093064]|uniref:pyridoxamine 5'-phosphate oxidase family protein n=1 Tax=Streptomyces sp. NPDC093064 TaxID=3366020 RepID=UPI0038175FFA
MLSRIGRTAVPGSLGHQRVPVRIDGTEPAGDSEELERAECIGQRVAVPVGAPQEWFCSRVSTRVQQFGRHPDRAVFDIHENRQRPDHWQTTLLKFRLASTRGCGSGVSANGRGRHSRRAERSVVGGAAAARLRVPEPQGVALRPGLTSQSAKSRCETIRAADSFARMTAMLNDSVRALLDAPVPAVLATVNPDGSPQTSVVWVGRDG